MKYIIVTIIGFIILFLFCSLKVSSYCNRDEDNEQK